MVIETSKQVILPSKLEQMFRNPNGDFTTFCLLCVPYWNNINEQKYGNRIDLLLFVEVSKTLCHPFVLVGGSHNWS